MWDFFFYIQALPYYPSPNMLATWPPAHPIYPEPSMVSFVITLSRESERGTDQNLFLASHLKDWCTLYATCCVS